MKKRFVSGKQRRHVMGLLSCRSLFSKSYERELQGAVKDADMLLKRAERDKKGHYGLSMRELGIRFDNVPSFQELRPFLMGSTIENPVVVLVRQQPDTLSLKLLEESLSDVRSEAEIKGRRVILRYPYLDEFREKEFMVGVGLLRDSKKNESEQA